MSQVPDGVTSDGQFVEVQETTVGETPSFDPVDDPALIVEAQPQPEPNPMEDSPPPEVPQPQPQQQQQPPPQKPPPPPAPQGMEVNVKYKTDKPPWTAPQQSFPGATRQQQGFIGYLESILKQNHQGLQIQVIRRGPAVWRNYQLVISKPIMTLAPMPIMDLKKAIVDLHGGGDYTVQIVTSTGTIAYKMNFDHDTLQTEPRIPRNASPSPTMNMDTFNSGGPPPLPGGPAPGVAGMPGYATMTPEGQQMMNTRMNERKMVTEMSERKAKRELENFDRKCKDEDEAYEEKQERKMRAPMEAFERETATLRREVDGKFDQLKDLIAAQGNNNKQDDGTTKLIIENMRASNENMITMLTSIINKPAPTPVENGSKSEVMEAVKLIMESNKAMIENMSKNQSAEASGYTELMKSLVLKTVNTPDNRAKEQMDMLERGINLATSLREVSAPPDEIFDPDGGVMGRLGNMFINGAKQFVSSGAGGRLAQAVTGALGQQPVPPPSNGQLYTPPPAAHAALPAPAPNPQAAPVQRAVAPPPSSSPYVEGFVDEESGGVVSENIAAPVPPVQQAQSAPAAAESDGLSEHVSAAMAEAVDDLDSKREDPDWVEYAGRKWGSFIGQLAQAPDDATRVNMLEARCDPNVVAAIHQRLQDPANVTLFMNGIRSLLTNYTGALSATS